MRSNQMNVFKKLFGKKERKKVETPRSGDQINKNYICLKTDPIHSMNDLREGDWNMDKVQQSLAMGMVRFAKESEVAEAKAIGRIKG